jgi:hypothetical protein
LVRVVPVVLVRRVQLVKILVLAQLQARAAVKARDLLERLRAAPVVQAAARTTLKMAVQRVLRVKVSQVVRKPLPTLTRAVAVAVLVLLESTRQLHK